jgi:hypothetical protein
MFIECLAIKLPELRRSDIAPNARKMPLLRRFLRLDGNSINVPRLWRFRMLRRASTPAPGYSPTFVEK